MYFSLFFCGLLFLGTEAHKLIPSFLKGRHVSLSHSSASRYIANAVLVSTLVISPPFLQKMPAFAVSGGGKDYATKDLREENFSGRKDLGGKDFTQCGVCVCVFRVCVCVYVYVSVSSFTLSVITNLIRIYIYIDATGVKFVDSVLSGSRFYRANLKDADFSRASLVGTSLEDTDLKGARFTGSVLKVYKLTILFLCISFPFLSHPFLVSLLH
jgi:hypothetical protein